MGLKTDIADLARPFALYSTAGSTSAAIVRFAFETKTDLSAAAVFIAAALGGVAALYVGKAWENRGVSGHNAQVETAKASNTPAPGTATISAAADVDVTVRDATDHDPSEFGGPRP